MTDDYPVISSQRFKVVAQYFNAPGRVERLFHLPTIGHKAAGVGALHPLPVTGSFYELVDGPLREVGIQVWRPSPSREPLTFGDVLGPLGMSYQEFRFHYADCCDLAKRDRLPPDTARGRHVAEAHHVPSSEPGEPLLGIAGPLLAIKGPLRKERPFVYHRSAYTKGVEKHKAIIILILIIVIVLSALGAVLYWTSLPLCSNCAAFAGVSLKLDYATTTAEQERGLGGRTNVPEGYGMLFVYRTSDYYGFWMKDMLVPIDMFWLDAKGRVVFIERDVATSTYPSVFYPPVPARYVLETAAGFAAVHAVATGTTLIF